MEGYKINRLPATIKEQAGITLIEIAVVLVIMGVLVSLAAPELSSSIKKYRVQDCVKRLASDIKQARAKAQADGQRAVVVVTKDTPQDFNSDGDSEHYLIFLDKNRNELYDEGETIIVEGVCQSGITMEAGDNPLQSCPSISNARCLEFTSLGTLNSDATGRRIQMKLGMNKVRITVVSIVGHLQIQRCEETTSGLCDNNNNWHDF
ncbi:MAG: GspH/FimT family pseudopilin [Thermodesulfovibrionales bacterium]